MCGICACIGDDAKKSVIENLKKLEYRGYDSCGLALLKDGKLQNFRTVGEVKNLENLVEHASGNIAIGHTRWATHGMVSVENSHPQLSANKKFALVHNGIVENFEELRRKYLKNVEFKSQTDTEVFVNLIEIQDGSILEKLTKACLLVKGNFAVALLFEDEEKIYLAKRGSPLVVACENGTAMAGSDLSIFADRFERCFALDDDEFAVLDGKSLKIFDKNGEKLDKKATFLKKDEFFEDFASKENFMLEEIEQQPMILRWTFFKFFNEGVLQESVVQKLRKFKNFHFIACGTALHSAMLGARFLKEICGKNAIFSFASEFRYDVNILSKNTLFVFVSQSGETADTLACAKLIKEKKLSSMCVTNVPYCSLNKICDFVLPTFAGREVAVASTKAYTAQIFSMLALAVLLSEKKEYILHLEEFVSNVKTQKFDEKMAKILQNFDKIFFIGRENDYVTALESALKLKEISYINCIAMPAGELKHGTLALVDEKTLVIAISTQQSLKSKIESNVVEVKSRKGKVLFVSQFDTDIDVDFLLKLPSFDELLMPIVAIFPLQRLAFDIAKDLGFNPDKPRNLAKSVTVE